MSTTENDCKTWTPCEDVLENFANRIYAIVILNCRINLNIDHRQILNLWSHAKLRVTVDGGTEKWLNWLQAHESDEYVSIAPDLITGDLDSVSLDVLEYFKQRNSQVIHTPDQNETDYTKALREVQKYCSEKEMNIDSVFVLADTSGRFDQIIANINTLFKAAVFMKDTKIYQIASNSITFLLPPGNHRISIPESLREKQEWCALMPLGAPCMATSKGLKWNLDQTRLTFGEMVSTSNTYDGDPYVTVTTDGYITWSMGIEAIL
ncbi:thiamin pyrophosphokinase 1 [Dendroctonus ponderosae]|uniref:Thiamin pyrophosphokinase thiamin-binding domain-containing protein n=1 Tax=Dendroctonus ponderosae TaxID=77166 RepID=J3JUK3_DENPD